MLDCKIEGVRRVVNSLFVGSANVKRKSVFSGAKESKNTILNVRRCETNFAEALPPKVLELFHIPPVWSGRDRKVVEGRVEVCPNAWIAMFIPLLNHVISSLGAVV
jgi:hypothetical protein